MEAEDATNETEGRGLRDRFGMGRLSLMMKELETLKLGEGIAMGMPTIPGGFSSNFSIATRGFVP
jgi:hypothetical protein